MTTVIYYPHFFKSLILGSFIIITFIASILSVLDLPVNEVQGQQQQNSSSNFQIFPSLNSSLTNNNNISSLTNASSVFRYPSLVIVTNVDDSNTNNINTTSFSQVVTNTYQTSDGYAIAFHFTRGSDFGVNMNLRPGSFVIADEGVKAPLLNHIYNTTYTGDCIGVKSTNDTVIGYGEIKVGEAKICNIKKSIIK